MMQTRQRTSRRWLATTALALLAAGVALAMHLSIRGEGYRADEVHHHTQIRWLLDGELRRLPNLLMFPLYHMAMAAVAWPFGWTGLDDFRLLNLALSAVALSAVSRAARATCARDAGLRTAQAVALPCLLPLVFLVYTDVAALGMLAAALFAVQRRRHRTAAALGFVSILLRQTNAVWVVFLAALALTGERERGAGDERWPATAARAGWPFAAALAGFALLAALVMPALLRPGPPYTSGLYTGNLVFGLALLAVLFAPLHAANSVALFALMRRRPGTVAAALVATAAAMWLGLRERNALNRLPDFLHNEVLAAVATGGSAAALLFVAVAVGLLAVAATPLAPPSRRLLPAAAALALLPLAVIEPRYSLVPLVLWNLFRAPATRAVELALVVWNGALSALLWYAIVEHKLFL